MATHSFDPKDVIVTVGGFPIGGWADGEFMSFERNSDAFTQTVGADGDTTRVKSNDKSGNLTLTLDQTSLSNDVLSAIATADELSNSGIVPVLIKELNGTSTLFAGNGWVQKLPVMAYGKETTTRVWVIAMAETNVFVGGNIIN